jgi:adenylate kinase
VHSKPPKVTNKCDICGSELIHRADDREETVRERLRVYRAQTAELIPYYRAKGLLREVPGEGDIETIYADQVKCGMRSAECGITIRGPCAPT